MNALTMNRLLLYNSLHVHHIISPYKSLLYQLQQHTVSTSKLSTKSFFPRWKRVNRYDDVIRLCNQYKLIPLGLPEYLGARTKFHHECTNCHRQYITDYHTLMKRECIHSPFCKSCNTSIRKQKLIDRNKIIQLLHRYQLELIDDDIDHPLQYYRTIQPIKCVCLLCNTKSTISTGYRELRQRTTGSGCIRCTSSVSLTTYSYNHAASMTTPAGRQKNGNLKFTVPINCINQQFGCTSKVWWYVLS